MDVGTFRYFRDKRTCSCRAFIIQVKILNVIFSISFYYFYVFPTNVNDILCPLEIF